MAHFLDHAVGYGKRNIAKCLRHPARMKLLALFGIAMLALANSPAPSPQAAAVWNQEHAYWQAPVDQGGAVYQKVWDPAFVGWPCDEKGPVSGLPPLMSPDAVERSNVMDEQAATEAPNLVSTFYHVRERDMLSDGKVEITGYNVTHSGVPTPSGWKSLAECANIPIRRPISGRSAAHQSAIPQFGRLFAGARR